jgi:hypothetical protein
MVVPNTDLLYLEIPEYSGNELASQMVLQGGTLESRWYSKIWGI